MESLSGGNIEVLAAFDELAEEDGCISRATAQEIGYSFGISIPPATVPIEDGSTAKVKSDLDKSEESVPINGGDADVEAGADVETAAFASNDGPREAPAAVSDPALNEELRVACGKVNRRVVASAAAVPNLLARGANPADVDEDSWTAIFYAAGEGLVDACRVLAAIVNVDCVDSDGCSALWIAVRTSLRTDSVGSSKQLTFSCKPLIPGVQQPARHGDSSLGLWC